MAQSRDESPSRIGLVVLACLSQSKPTTEDEIGEALYQLALANESAETARRRASELLTGLVRRGLVTSDSDASRSKSPTAPSPRKLTDSGRRALREAFQLKKAPTWSQVRDKHMPAMALGLSPGSEITKKACTESGLVAAVVGARLGIRNELTPTAVCDAV